MHLMIIVILLLFMKMILTMDIWFYKQVRVVLELLIMVCPEFVVVLVLVVVVDVLVSITCLILALIINYGNTSVFQHKQIVYLQLISRDVRKQTYYTISSQIV